MPATGEFPHRRSLRFLRGLLFRHPQLEPSLDEFLALGVPAAGGPSSAITCSTCSSRSASLSPFMRLASLALGSL
jgi:hypothetical protein